MTTERFNLKKGDRFNLTKNVPSLEEVKVRLYWKTKTAFPKYDLDLSIITLKNTDVGPKIFNDDWVVFFNNERTPNGEIVKSPDARDSGEEIGIIKLNQILPEADEESFIVTIFEPEKFKQTFGQLEEAGIEIINNKTGDVICFFDLDEQFTTETAVQIGSLIKVNNEWSFQAVGAGYNLELGDILNGYC